MAKFVVWHIGVEMPALVCCTVNCSSFGTGKYSANSFSGKSNGIKYPLCMPTSWESMALNGFTTHNQNVIGIKTINCQVALHTLRRIMGAISSLSTQQLHNSSIQTKQ